ncbi:MAG: L,D-transpeptidase family protein [Bacteroidetes bacterium]|nr:L,D-transpeptidase family protein [Bacteroidota bacterium]
MAIKDTLPSPTPDLSLPGSFSTQETLRFDSVEMQNFFHVYPQWKPYQKEVIRFYQKRQFAYAWYDRQGLIEQAWHLYNTLQNIGEEGVSDSLLYATEFRQRMESMAVATKTMPDTTLEWMLTAQYFSYAKRSWFGLGTKGMQAIQWDLSRKKLAYEDFLDTILNTSSTDYFQQPPIYPQYQLLKAQLKKYRAIASKGGWGIIPAFKGSLRRGDSNVVLKSIRKRLYSTDDFEGDTTLSFMDDVLEAAIKKFQYRHGLTEDGVIGRKVAEAMNVSVRQRIEQIIVNMERCRWVPVHLKDEYFIVNIPAFRFYAFKDDSVLWSMKVVVGKSIHQTAIFNGTMKYVVFAPYWNVPPGILRNEVLPALGRNPAYLNKNHMERHGNTVRQLPGPWNALGKVKFLFPNSHNIYLHDTPAKDLFKQDQRSFSHGCIRVEQPRRLAQYVLRYQPGWNEQRIDSAMNGTKEMYVTLQKTFPVFIAYFTAWADRAGGMHFRNDIYGKDARLLEMLLVKK